MTTTPHLKAVLNLPTPCRFVQIQSPLLEYIMQHTDRQPQLKLHDIHEAMLQTLMFWNSGLITDQEITNQFARVSADLKLLEQQGLLKGVLDPNTGLRY